MNVSNNSLFRLGYHLSKAELAKRHATTFGGMFWTFITPIVTILTIWIALDHGLGMRKSAGAGYGQALVSGLVVWLFISESITTGSQAILSNPHFVKKIKFPVELLPTSCVFAALIVHLVILAVIELLLVYQGVMPGWHTWTLPLWLALALVTALAFALLTAALTVVIPDVGAVLPSVIGLLFWLTPIVWPLSMVPDDYRWIALINPITIIVEGYRYALTGVPMQIEQGTLIMTCLLLMCISILSLIAFKRMRPVFADLI